MELVSDRSDRSGWIQHKSELSANVAQTVRGDNSRTRMNPNPRSYRIPAGQSAFRERTRAQEMTGEINHCYDPLRELTHVEVSAMTKTMVRKAFPLIRPMALDSGQWFAISASGGANQSEDQVTAQKRPTGCWQFLRPTHLFVS